MAAYRDWRLTLALHSPLGTPMQSDTLFGHLCWQVLLREGEAALEDFLEPFRRGEPSFVLSDAFPAGLLPRPLVRWRRAAADSPEEYAAGKRWRKAPFVRAADFQRLRADPQSDVEPVPSPWRTVTMAHAAIDRRIETTGGEDSAGRFYQTEALALEGAQSVEVYVRCLPEMHHRVRALFDHLSQSGFGRDKSQGLGAFAVSGIESWEDFGDGASATAFVSLSSFVPAMGDPVEGRWRLRVKRGYLGEHLVAGNPFKRPLVEFEPGAVFRIGSGKIAPFYGRLVGQIAPGLPSAVQCGFTLPVPCTWNDG